MALLESVLIELGAEYEANGQAEFFAALRPRLVAGSANEPLATIARRVGRTEGALRTAVHRLRRRYGELLRTAVANTVEDSGEIDNELAELFQALAGKPS